MAVHILYPEFFVDFAGHIHKGGIAINGQKIIDPTQIPRDQPTKVSHLPNKVILPGFVNAHSHAFQRGLRGLVEKKAPHGVTDNFFSWREKMYALANMIGPQELELIAKLAFWEMLEAGFTHVGEFHYLHHAEDGAPYQDMLANSRALARAASTVGTNLTLLECAYHRHNFAAPITKQQRRFKFDTVHDFLAFVGLARRELAGSNIKIGVAIHSVRAVDESWFAAINDFVSTHALPLHIHASEQRSDVETCLTHRQCSPIALLNRHQLLTQSTTLIHATHLIDDDLELVENSRPQICICPSTEKNLGDGMPPLSELKARAMTLCIGTDQHVRLDAFDEARSLEEQERQKHRQRNILNEPSTFLYESLLPVMSRGGMKALFPNFEGTSLIGHDANLIAVDLPPEYEWHGPEVALDAMMMSSNTSKVSMVMTNGRIVIDQAHTHSDEKTSLEKEIGKFFRRQKFF